MSGRIARSIRTWAATLVAVTGAATMRLTSRITLPRVASISFAMCVLVSRPPKLLAGDIKPGDIFIVVASPGRVYRITDGGDFSSAQPYASGLTDPYGLAFAPDGRLFVGERSAGEVTDITRGGDFSGVPAYATGLSSPRDLLITAIGTMLVAEWPT
ncbi:MAG: hypothetical protein IID33_12460, partial [Planctomycetes bacterium]|nr:hypothetical protein [Planctomycetota bacterium]